ncbi:ParB/RepB/Spo0J family partition protein [Aetokthonos hydrillicola Thurmond2011]|jgi:ParB family chromosome partitioning protein|uniref:ParB/RepB/Spo0J family partition protein n=1 Tax=Aetokthonos hydrillicola Thurmond2011 TaxID=2712845 RepID=A0AAP5MDL5_9CYAN|nr:ParB/RepB/Spo0J family partition protein [Aetokthonos hydrillicola]MBO3460120.1 ParB/RepB/Spo0J family partition protein [Aetokthonos hydrillicola CCALA 1050]MBW4590728.1 ParB/RepB/Spo0J family partition protein [Aetokthonos hydrillicola CCALA 1050]MDR9899778.1 ParB/RepB/Spo0J family partition protein [Aetokthonos hydrillicola Thurmond2011]
MLLEKSIEACSKYRTNVNYSSFPVQYRTKVSIDLIQLSLKQPRRYFDPKKLAQLIESIKEHGILEPVLVRPLYDGQYELIAGERRIRAAREAGLVEVPIVLLELDDQQALQIALIENLQREELNPVEETEAILELLSLSLGIDTHEVVSLLHLRFNAKQRGQKLNQNVLIQLEKIESLFSQLGKFNVSSFRASRLPLLNLSSDLLSVLRRGEIEYTKAQTIGSLKSEQQRAELLKIAIAENLSLSQIKTRVKALKSQTKQESENTFTEQFNAINKLLHQKNYLIKTQNKEKISSLLDELKILITEG